MMDKKRGFMEFTVFNGYITALFFAGILRIISIPERIHQCSPYERSLWYRNAVLSDAVHLTRHCPHAAAFATGMLIFREILTLKTIKNQLKNSS
ncbi:MAG: hypothetical protein ABIN24_07840 [Dyadobacter sp.]